MNTHFSYPPRQIRDARLADDAETVSTREVVKGAVSTGLLLVLMVLFLIVYNLLA